MENDLLEVRLNELYDIVDKFVLVESKYTHSGLPKPLYFGEDKQRFSKFLDKIEHIIVEEFEGCKCNWEREKFQRDAISRGLTNCKPDDIIIISDSDELPKAKTLLKCKDLPGIKVLEQFQYNFFLNYINDKEKIWRRGPRVLFYKDFNNNADSIRYTQGELIKDGGWHFSFLGGLESIKSKIRNFSHQEYNNDYYLNDNRLQKTILDGLDIFERGYKYKIVNIDGSFPVYLKKNKAKFQHLILKPSSILNKVKNALSFTNTKKKRHVETHKPINENPILDFIASTSSKILEIGESVGLKHLVENKFHPEQHLNVTFKNIHEIDNLPEDTFNCVILDKTLNELYNPEEVLSKLKTKLNRNGFIIMTVPNFRHIKVLNQILFKKTFIYETKNIRHFTMKSLSELISRSGYYIITFKGLNPTNSFDYKVKNLFFVGNLYDSRHEEFLVVIKH